MVFMKETRTHLNRAMKRETKIIIKREDKNIIGYFIKKTYSRLYNRNIVYYHFINEFGYKNIAWAFAENIKKCNLIELVKLFFKKMKEQNVEKITLKIE